MLKHLFIISIVVSSLIANENPFAISSISDEVKKRMIKGNSYKKGCPVPLKNLRYLTIKHLGFDGKDKIGEMIVHKDVAKDVVDIFSKMYKMGYPIYKMQLVSNYKGDDWESIEANNTSAFNCRPITGKKNKWSRHAYGKAIDINPIENPYVNKKGYISHKESLKYKIRKRYSKDLKDKAVLLKGDKVVKLFKNRGWVWGGDWITIKDYQHFDYRK